MSVDDHRDRTALAATLERAEAPGLANDRSR